MNVVQIAFDAVQCFCTAMNGTLGTEARRFSSTRVRTSLLREFDERVARGLIDLIGEGQSAL
jgi:hypothetical protein